MYIDSLISYVPGDGFLYYSLFHIKYSLFAVPDLNTDTLDGMLVMS
jgi:hypothetical protein